MAPLNNIQKIKYDKGHFSEVSQQFTKLIPKNSLLKSHKEKNVF